MLSARFSYGDRAVICNLLQKLKAQARDTMRARKPRMVRELRALGDYVIELRWDFHSWLPLVSSLLPSDTCTISKKGRNSTSSGGRDS